MHKLIAGILVVFAACQATPSKAGVDERVHREIAVLLDKEEGGDCLDKGMVPSLMLDELEMAERHEGPPPRPLAMITDFGTLYVHGEETFPEIAAYFPSKTTNPEDYTSLQIGDAYDIVGDNLEYFSAMYNARLAALHHE